MHQNSPLIGMLIHQRQKPVPVFVREKDRLSIIATLRDVQRIVGRSESGFARHSLYMWIPPPILLIYFAKKIGGVQQGGHLRTCARQ